jgi:hypothetical protein
MSREKIFLIGIPGFASERSRYYGQPTGAQRVPAKR